MPAAGARGAAAAAGVVAVGARGGSGATADVRSGSRRSLGCPIATAMTTIPIANAIITKKSQTDRRRGDRARVGDVCTGST
jgi:hypothetical protein